MEVEDRGALLGWRKLEIWELNAGVTLEQLPPYYWDYWHNFKGPENEKAGMRHGNFPILAVISWLCRRMCVFIKNALKYLGVTGCVSNLLSKNSFLYCTWNVCKIELFKKKKTAFFLKKKWALQHLFQVLLFFVMFCFSYFFFFFFGT